MVQILFPSDDYFLGYEFHKISLLVGDIDKLAVVFQSLFYIPINQSLHEDLIIRKK